MKSATSAIVALPILLLVAGGMALAQVPATHENTPPNQTTTTATVGASKAQPESGVSSWVNPVISSLAGLLGALIGGYFATRNAKAAIVQKTNELEIEAIDERIGNFIAPYEQLSLENLKLARELKRRHGGSEFRTLLALLDPDWKKTLSQGDRALVDAIVANGSALRQMILEHGGAVSTAIRPHLAAASMHFRMLALADAGSLDSDPKRYETYVYPRQLDDVLIRERDRLESRREELRGKPDVAHAAIKDLEIPPDLRMLDA